MERYTFFFTEHSPFSQWHPSTFTLDGVTFGCAEQAMMHGKALLFGDAATAAEILQATHPRDHKALGRKVAGFVDSRWVEQRVAIVERANHAKFTQNPALHALLLATAGTRLVEASPYDRIWGVGLAETDPRIQDPRTWRGQNLLGDVLTRLRETLLEAG